MDHQLHETIQRAISTLPSLEARVLTLHFGIGYTYQYSVEEICYIIYGPSHTEKDFHTVKEALANALRALRDIQKP
jgi:DNA-directed RNA polymerase specialized sigma24 family protein